MRLWPSVTVSASPSDPCHLYHFVYRNIYPESAIRFGAGGSQLVDHTVTHTDTLSLSEAIALLLAAMIHAS